MAVIIEEKFGSRSSSAGNNPSVVLEYFIFGTEDDLEAKSELLLHAPAFYDGLVKTNTRILRVADTVWDGSVQYGFSVPTPAPAETGDSSFTFDTGGGTQHITQSKETIALDSSPGNPVFDFDGAIGVSGDSIDGVDIVVPVYQFTETHYLSDATVNAAYRGVLFRATGKTNDAAFKGLAEGECLFLGASGSKRTEGDWEITYTFAASENATGLTVGAMTGIDKKGWEYLWVLYDDVVDAVAQAIVKQPSGVYIERVYDDADFSQLGIGV